MSDSAQPLPKAPRPRKRRDVAVGLLVRHAMEGEARRRGMVAAQVLVLWPRLCPLLARWSCALELRRGVLKVAVANDAVKQELTYLAPQVLAAVNMLLGYAGAERVQAVTQTLPMPPPPHVPAPAPDAAAVAKAVARCQHVGDAGLREALVALGARVYQQPVQQQGKGKEPA